MDNTGPPQDDRVLGMCDTQIVVLIAGHAGAASHGYRACACREFRHAAAPARIFARP